MTEQDFEIVAKLREAGFSRISGNAPSNGDVPRWVDDLDRQPGVFCLIGHEDAGEPVATLRVQDERVSTLELTRFVPLDDLLLHEHRPAAQFARLSVTKGPHSTKAMFAVFKAAWRWCLLEGISSIVIATPPWSRYLYDFMLFEELGSSKGHFRHKFAADALHVAMRLPVAGAERLWRAGGSPLCEQFFDTKHPALELT